MPKLALLLLVVTIPAIAELKIPENPLYETIQDEVYLQEIPTLIPTEHALQTVAVFEGTAYVGDAQGLWKVDGEQLKKLDGPTGDITAIKTLNDTLWVLGPNGIWNFDGKKWEQVHDGKVTDACVHNGKIVFSTDTELLEIKEDASPSSVVKLSAPVLGLESYGGTIYVHDGSQVGRILMGAIRYRGVADWGHLERGATIRDMMALGSRLYVATDEGLGLLRGMTWYSIQGEDGLPYEDTTTLAQGFDRDLWIGTKRGAIRNVEDEYHFFGHQRWIPHDQVNAIACGDKVTYIATEGGLGIITYEPYTLAKKAAYYERWLDEWGMKRLGFIHILFDRDGQWLREVSDNDVGYSSHYMSAKCFEYAVTGNPEARAAAVDMMKTVKWSEEITSIDGFPARSIYAVNELTVKADHGSGGLPAEWHATPDGEWEWKGDTSSDETDAHVYETAIFLSLVANAKEKVWATEHLERVAGHIVDNGFFLRDVDGKPTRWARWDPEYLQTPYGYYARGLNGMEAFNYMTTALHFTGNQKFQEGIVELSKQNYFREILQQKVTFSPLEFTHFDDRLAFYSYFPLVQFETDSTLKSLWRQSLERSWEIKRIEAVPWFNFIYGALTGNDCESDKAVAHLREWPLDLRRYSYHNSHRDDLYPPKGYRMYSERPKQLSMRATAPNRWDGDFMRLDEGYGGSMVADPGGWLDAYWMGRYYGMISAPKTNDKSLTTVPHRGLQLGAKPYDGPSRPKLEHEQ